MDQHDYEDHLRRHDHILEGLARLFAAQHETNQRLEAFVDAQRETNTRLEGFVQEQRVMNQRQDGINQRLTGAVERIDTTLAHLQTLMTEVFRDRHNGHED